MKQFFDVRMKKNAKFTYTKNRHMKKYLVLLITVLFFTAAFALEKGKWTGFISDENCGKKENMKGHSSCAKTCVKGGAKPVLVVGEKIYAISNPEKVGDLVGEEVVITGSLTKDAIEIKTIKAK